MTNFQRGFKPASDCKVNIKSIHVEIDKFSKQIWTINVCK